MHLHVHTEYSLLDGAIRTKDLAAKVSSWGSKSVAVTDHGVLYGAVEFYEACRAHALRPILGCEAYIVPEGITSREAKRTNHLILLAENFDGWHNLMKLVSIANTQGFYYHPRIDHSLIETYHRGLIASSACLAGEIAQFIIHDDYDNAEARAGYYRDVFGDGNFFLEMMHNHIPEQRKVNEGLLRIHQRTGIPVIATSDAHFLTREDMHWHKVFKRINTHSDTKAKDTPNDSSDAYDTVYSGCYLAEPEEMYSYFHDIIPQALTNTVAIADRCNVELKLNHEHYYLPDLELPEGVTLDDELRTRAHAGLSAKFSAKGLDVPEEYQKRIDYELDVITKMGFSAYFLIVSGIIQAAKKRNIPIGPGRGSAAGSVVAWSLQITELDPLRYNLLFERFLNPERISMPDIDTDVSDKGRDELLKYISDHYGSDHVAQIITFGRMKGRQSIKDVGRAMGEDFALMDKTAKLVPEKAKNIDEALQDSDQLKEAYEDNPVVHDVIDTARNIEGLARHTSQHAAGVVISPVPITDLVPVKRLGSDKDTDTGQVVTQFTMEGVEKLGLVKMDFLGLSTLSIIDEAMHNIKANGKTPPNLSAINDAMNDHKTFKLLQDADTMGVFQLESDGMRAMLRKLRIDCFEDLVAALAMYRPGPLETGMVEQYIECKHGRAVPHYPHPLLESTLKETYGVILYQEQVMQAANILAGYTMGEADMLRKAMGKKKIEVMKLQRAKFMAGAEKNNIPPETAGSIFDDIEKFAGYGFNKSHSAAYALISYDTAYLKANYRAEFMAAYLSSQMKAKREVLGHYVMEVKHSGIDVLPPDINVSNESFTPDGEVIRFGLGAVSRLGHNTVDMIVHERETAGKYRDLWDFIQRVDMSLMNKTVFENLIKAGAFDSMNPNRAQMLGWLVLCLDAVQKNTKLLKKVQNQQAKTGEQLLLCFEEDEYTPEPKMPQIPIVDDYTCLDKLTAEKAVTGLYMSGHPYEAYSDTLRGYVNCWISDLLTEGQKWMSEDIMPCIGGIVSALNVKTTKKGETMCIMKLEDAEASIDVVIFPKMWQEMKDILSPGNAYIVTGKLDDRRQFLPEKIVPADEAVNIAQKYVKIVVNVEMHTELNMRNFVLGLNRCRGKARLLMELRERDEAVLLWLKEFSVDGAKIRELVSGILPDGMYEIVAA